MRRWAGPAIGAGFLLMAAPAGSAQLVPPVQRHSLSNGMTVLILEDHSAPTFCYMSYFKVGSRNERPGITGISHLFEHMMFNGSARFGPKVFDRLIESGGGYSNGSTWTDYTNYYEEVSSEALETVLELESDRMRSLLITPENLEQERSIVKEERRLRTDNSTDGKLFELLTANAFLASPYRWPVVGWEPDLDNITLEDCKEYFRTYYAPNNAVVAIVGDVQAARVAPLMQKHFGDIPSQPAPRPVIDAEPPQKGEKRVVHRMQAELPAVMIGYKSVDFRHDDYPATEVLRAIVSEGESSRFYQSLVYDKQIATETWAFFRPTLHRGLFIIYAQAKPETRPEALEAALYDELARLAGGGTADREVQKARNQIRAAATRELKDNAGRADRMAFYEVMTGDHAQMNAVLDRIDKVTKDDVTRVARTWFQPEGRTVVTLVPDDEP
ncbi:MAG TPA: pitrilysin family protein [Candidatus Polarisedimenticolia bacterium]|nr:pitrilysin family protein [Candidatus Polarisedimenticolia bacterium]